MKKAVWTFALIACIGSAGFGAMVNNVVASVGNYAITTYDIKRMSEFLQISSGMKSDYKSAFNELLYGYSLVFLSDNEEQILVRDQEVNNYIESMTNQPNGNAAQFYREYVDQLKLEYRKNLIIRSILSYDQALKLKISGEIPEKDMRSFFNKNQSMMREPASMDAIILGVVQPKTGSLDELDRFDKNLLAVAEALKKTDDINAIFAKYKTQFAFENFSGRTGMRSVYDLVKAGYPTEALQIGLSPKPIEGPKGLVTMKKGSVYGPMPMVLQNTGKPTYLIVKLINRQLERNMTYDAAKPLIERKLRDDMANNVFKQYVIDKITSGDITVNMLDKNYEGAYNEFVRR